jgi:hypothetical protein
MARLKLGVITDDKLVKLRKNEVSIPIGLLCWLAASEG